MSGCVGVGVYVCVRVYVRAYVLACMRGYSTCVHLYTHSLIVCPLSDTVCSHTSLPLLPPPPGSGGVGTAVIIGVVVAVATVILLLIIIITVFATVLVCVKHKSASE